MSLYLITISADMYDGREYEASNYFDGEMTREGFLDFITEITSTKNLVPGTVVTRNVLKFDEKPVDVRMSAESLIELQRAAMARAIESFGQYLERDHGYPHASEYAEDYAKDIRAGRRES